MEISYNWLLEYLPKPVSIDELSKILTSIGLEVEGIAQSEAIKGSLKNLVIGQVITCVPHPNADKLKQTTVDVGDGIILPIVCGAPNVAAGQKVVVAPVGTIVHPTNGDAFEIKKAKIRGEVSEGMICAEDEIGLGSGHDGIMVLPEDATVGMKASRYFNIPRADNTISIGLTPNRSDAMSHVGVARDVCAYLAHHNKKEIFKVVYPQANVPIKKADLPIKVTVENTTACPRYMGITIADVSVAPSPEWLQLRLKAIGVRPVNNIVDITNFVLHELGQPLHAFDYGTLSGKEIIVKNLPENSVFQTLDEKERKLRAEDLMICDAEKGLCIAGVFGGLTSGITEKTKNVFLESAYFDAKTIRRTSMHHGLRTDAATHFEKVVDMEMVEKALKRAAALIVEIAGGIIASEIIDIYPQQFEPRKITASYKLINLICGKSFEPAIIDDVLTALGFRLLHKKGDTFEVEVPSNKADVLQAADLAEEVLRIDGLDNVPMNSRISMSLNQRPEPAARKWKEKIANHLCNSGMHEIITNSISNSKYYPEHKDMVHMLNNLSSELDVMRPELLESGLEVLAYNINRKQQDLMLFELGNVYRQSSVGHYEQTPKLGVWLTGNITAQQWQSKAQPSSIFYAKGIVERLLHISGIAKYQETNDEKGIEWKRGKALLAKAYSVSEEKLKAFDIKQNVYYIEADIDNWVAAAENTKVKYSELPKFPMMKRDLALVVDKSMTYDKIAAVAKSQKWEAYKGFELFDVFESEKLGTDKKSLALSFTFQLKDRTLTDDEVDGMMKTLIQQFEKETGATIRL